MMPKTKTTFILLCLMLLFSSILPQLINSASAQSTKTITVKSGSTPNIDGAVGDSEWSDASSISFSTGQVFLKEDGTNLLVAFKFPFYSNINMQIFIDVNNDKTNPYQQDDIAFAIGTYFPPFGNHLAYSNDSNRELSGFTALYSSKSISEAEFKIPYSLLGIQSGVDKTLGVDFTVNYIDVINTPAHSANWATGGEGIVGPADWGEMNSNGYNWAIEPLSSPTVPEFPAIVAITLFMVATLSLPLVLRRKHSS
jgi:hypothetical protein